MSALRPRSALPWILILATACETAPQRLESSDVALYEECQDSVGRVALDAALVHVQAGRDSEALPLLRQAIVACPDYVRGHRLYQDTAISVGGEAEQQMRAYYDALPDDARSPVPQYAKGRLMPDTYSRREALRAILVRKPSFYWAHLSLARLYRSIDKDNQAMESYRSALALNRQLLEAHVELAETLVDIGRFGEAARHYESYVRGDPNDQVVKRSYLRLLLYRLGRVDAADRIVEELLAQDPEDDSLLMDRAAVQWRRGQYESAVTVYRRVLELRPDNARAIFNIGNIYFDALAKDDESRRRYWPRARDRYSAYLQLATPTEGSDYVERYLTVPHRLKVIDEFLGR